MDIGTSNIMIRGHVTIENDPGKMRLLGGLPCAGRHCVGYDEGQRCARSRKGVGVSARGVKIERQADCESRPASVLCFGELAFLVNHEYELCTLTQRDVSTTISCSHVQSAHPNKHYRVDGICSVSPL